ncbi:MAG: GGDEF domain-containing protein [Actinobacteria bacterium]|nr:GGDEF domain-containing protein [Actinomycetota bacterium]
MSDPIQARLERRIERERNARLESERIAEQATRELYDTVTRLESSRNALADAASLVRVLQQTAIAANEADTFDEAAAIALRSVCEHTGWPIGHVYTVNATGDRLIPLAVWHDDDPARNAAFIAATDRSELAVGVGLPGRVLATARPAWIPDVTVDANFPRFAAALETGLHAGFAFPVVVAGEVAAVLEFFSRKPMDPDDELLAVLANVGDQLGRVIERNAFQRRLEHQSLHDDLTGLPNRVLLLDRLEHALERSVRSGETVAVFFFDLDRFKAVNDSFGHQAGDQVLMTVAERVPTVLRPGDSLARLSGDEFVVLCEGVPDPDAAVDLADRILEVVAAPIVCEENVVHISASVGIAFSGAGAVTPEDLLGNADVAMYRAKERGRGLCQLFDEALRTNIVQRLETERSLRRAIGRGELVAHFQPVVDLRAGRIAGAEALVRWMHPERGLLLPGEFIALAEDTALIGRLGEWMLRETCRQLRHFCDLHPDVSLRMAVNLSVSELEQHTLVKHVTETLQAYAIPPEAIVFEITESAVMHDAEVVIRHLHELRELGFGLSIDDFGTGFSSLDRLRKMPVQTLKIDRSFITDMDTTPGGTALVAAIIAMSHSLGLEVVAEGVELPEQLMTVRRLGCDHAQGFLLGRPATLDDLTHAMASGHIADVLAAAPVDVGSDVHDEMSRIVANALNRRDEVARATRSVVAEIQRLVGGERPKT